MENNCSLFLAHLSMFFYRAFFRALRLDDWAMDAIAKSVKQQLVVKCLGVCSFAMKEVGPKTHQNGNKK